MMQWGGIPDELRAADQWCVAGVAKNPMTAGADGRLVNASVVEPGQWMPFGRACELAAGAGLGVGFVLCADDPFSCIDLDVKDASNCPDKPETWTTPEQFDLFYRIMLGFDSYTEASRSGKGLHIWVRGKIGKGVRRDGIEIYSQERFIICTGAIVQNRPLRECEMMLLNMATQMRPVAAHNDNLVEVAEDEDDWCVLEKAVRAENKDKFCGLWSGQWTDLGFPSQSEADLALMSMFTFYSASNSQCRRLFRMSALGQREKAVKDDRYLNLTLKGLRSRIARESRVELGALLSAADTMMQARAEVARLQGVPMVPPRVTVPLHVPGQVVPTAGQPVPPSVAVTQCGPVGEDALRAGAEGMPWPPGFAGRIAQFIYNSAPRPVKEVAVVAALGLLAGICGKAWHIPQSGLNMYIILVARSAVGKESMHSGISAIIKACTSKMPSFHNFIDFSDFVSGPALVKACAANPSFLNVSGEWGRKLKRLANDDRDGPLATLRTQMTNLYQKSGPQAIVGGITYSNKDNNIASISGVAYSMIGETTPSTFYESLTEGMMEDGFLSRFLVIAYDGNRPPMNPAPVTVPDAALQDALVSLAFQAHNLIANHNSQPLSRTEGAARIMGEFELECDGRINGTDDESQRQMWNRAGLKVIRLAGLLAVADNWINPCINELHMEWALAVIRKDITIMGAKLADGDVGVGDMARERKVVAILKEYLSSEITKGYKIPDGMLENSIIPRTYLQTRTARVSSFYGHRLGHTAALNQTLDVAVSNGYLMEVDKNKLSDTYNYHGKAYRIVKLPDSEFKRK